MPSRSDALPPPRLVKALAHPLRVRILDELENGIASPSELARRLDEPVTKLAYHVSVLASLRMIELDDTRQVRGTVEHFYKLPEHRARLDDERIEALFPPGDLRDGWLALAEALREGDLLDPRMRAMTLYLDERARDELAEALRDLQPCLAEVAASATERMKVTDAEPIEVVVGTACFERAPR